MTLLKRAACTIYIILNIIIKFIILIPIIIIYFGNFKLKDGSYLGHDINLQLNFSSFIGIMLENFIRLKRCIFNEYLINQYYPKEINIYKIDNDNYDKIYRQKLCDIINVNKYTILYFGSCS